MSTIGWILILSALLVIRQVSRGRVMNLGEDLSDGFIALLTGDSEQFGIVLTRTGDSNTASAPDLSGVDALSRAAIVGVNLGVGLAAVARQLGSKAKGYRWAAAGPDYYDCSGLVYKAAQASGYKGGRFTTGSLPSNKAFKKISPPGTQGPNVVDATTNDIVVWQAGSGGVTGHMGIITGPDTFYSARSVKTGIGESRISTFRKTRPDYYRMVLG